MVSHTSGAAIASAIAPADARLEDAWDDIEQQVNRHPRGDDEVPVDRVFEDVDEPFAVERTVKEFGRLDVLVNNAAFQNQQEGLDAITDEQWERTFRTNIFGYFYMARAALPHLKEGASIINTTSVVSLRGSAQLLDYSATKGAINAFTLSLAESLVEKGIRVNAVAPGPVWTPLNPADKDAESVKDFGKQTVFKRPAQPEELAPAYVFLAAPVCSSYITGTILPVTGQIGT